MMTAKKEPENTLHNLPAQEAGICATAAQVLRQEAQALETLASRLNGTFAEAVRLFEGLKGRVIVTGMGKSGHVGHKIAATFASTGTPAFFVHPGEASHGDLGMITENDAVLALSNSGETKELGDIIHYCRRYSIPLVAMVSKTDSTLAHAADVVLPTHVTEEACLVNMAPTTSTTVSMALGDALAVSLMERRGFKAVDFHRYHPGGKLGSQMLHVKEIMARDAAVPLVKEGTLMAEALLEMTQKNLGGVGIVNAAGTLIGMITDGDLKRHMASDLLNKPVESVMTRNPTTISHDALAVDGVRLMTAEPRKTALFVVDAAQKPVGILHIHHCLQAGVL